MGERYAVYVVPEPTSPLYRFGSAVIGYDAHTGTKLSDAERGAFADLVSRDAVADPARYGFHATIRPPFEPADDHTLETIQSALALFAATQPPVSVGRLAVRVMSRFVALLPVEPTDALSKLAADTVRATEAFRAPLSPSDRARRLSAQLTPRQIAHIDTWGYPYVFDDFRFHMTLAGPLEPAACERVAAALGHHYEGIDSPLTIDALTLLKQPDRAAPFHVMARIPLSG
jgi:hypothetical protein